ncbi:hypothetical protein HPB48_017369 [Haemaphysalis longicornis]|uniref:Uncharacterized protein n=1 Tax=Haemaphysalis longicornis TaxID=44386 RepID=A0A9J6G9L9_HAELO|nr:hypothetical protein HPB48_017369 [Haemaphysalis longicornis]
METPANLGRNSDISYNITDSSADFAHSSRQSDYSRLVKKFVIPPEQIDVLTCRLEDHLNPKPYLGYLFETYVDNVKAQMTDGFSLTDEAVMRESCIRFITTRVDQIRQRLPENITVLQKQSLLSAENAFCVVKEPLIPLLEAMAVPLRQSQKLKTSGAKSHLLDWKKYRPRSRSGVKLTAIRMPAAKTYSPSWPELPF